MKSYHLCERYLLLARTATDMIMMVDYCVAKLFRAQDALTVGSSNRTKQGFEYTPDHFRFQQAVGLQGCEDY